MKPLQKISLLALYIVNINNFTLIWYQINIIYTMHYSKNRNTKKYCYILGFITISKLKKIVLVFLTYCLFKNQLKKTNYIDNTKQINYLLIIQNITQHCLHIYIYSIVHYLELLLNVNEYDKQSTNVMQGVENDPKCASNGGGGICGDGSYDFCSTNDNNTFRGGGDGDCVQSISGVRFGLHVLQRHPLLFSSCSGSIFGSGAPNILLVFNVTSRAVCEFNDTSGIISAAIITAAVGIVDCIASVIGFIRTCCGGDGDGD
eukprot:492653_1